MATETTVQTSLEDCRHTGSVETLIYGRAANDQMVNLSPSPQVAYPIVVAPENVKPLPVAPYLQERSLSPSITAHIV